MKCRGCGHDVFWQEVEIRASLIAVLDGEGNFRGFVGDVEGQVEDDGACKFCGVDD